MVGSVGSVQAFNPFRGLKRYYKSSSPDFVLSQTSILKEVLSGSAPNIVVGCKVSQVVGGACQTRSGMPFDRVVTGGGIFDTAGLLGSMRFGRVIRVMRAFLKHLSRFDLLCMDSDPGWHPG